MDNSIPPNKNKKNREIFAQFNIKIYWAGLIDVIYFKASSTVNNIGKRIKRLRWGEKDVPSTFGAIDKNK